jgi:FdhD protein
MGVAIVVSRSGITQMGFDLAQRLSLCTIGRATNKHFLCYTQSDRLVLDAKQS